MNVYFTAHDRSLVEELKIFESPASAVPYAQKQDIQTVVWLSISPNYKVLGVIKALKQVGASVGMANIAPVPAIELKNTTLLSKLVKTSLRIFSRPSLIID